MSSKKFRYQNQMIRTKGGKEGRERRVRGGSNFHPERELVNLKLGH
jgi:hypothetical protein